MAGAEDPELLAWAAKERRILLTHDAATIPGYAYERIEAGAAMPGVIEVPSDLPIGQAIEELVLLMEAGRAEDFEDRVIYLPL